MRKSLIPNKPVKRRTVIRVLIYPNITYMKDLDKDSYVHDMYNQIKELNESDVNYWFYLITPSQCARFDCFDNVTQWVIHIPGHPPTMRIHFNTQDFSNLKLDKYDFDVIYNHTPESNFALRSYIYNATGLRPLVVGYAHWFDFKEVLTWDMGALDLNLLGLLEMERCFINTQYQKTLVLKYAMKLFNHELVNKLNEILVVLHPPVHKSSVLPFIRTKTKKVIVFNHRPWKYKFFNEFMELMDRLYEQRQDFTVWVPLLANSDREYVSTESLDKKEYYQRLSECRVGFSPKQLYGGWSVATTDGLMNGCPFIMFDELYYKELSSEADFFKDDDEALELLNKYLDDNSYRNKKAKTALNEALTLCDTGTVLEDIILGVIELSKRRGPNAKGLDRIVEIVKEHGGSMTKAELYKILKWGKSIDWSAYRRTLMDDGLLKDSMEETPHYCLPRTPLEE